MKFFVFCTFLCASLGLAQPQDFLEAEALWLEQTEWIASPLEKETFLTLAPDERSKFIEAFWAARDPVPATSENEFKTEHLRRIEHANQHFRAGKAGSKTDRGWAYIVLGPPKSTQSFRGKRNLFPLEIWEYNANGRLGLPSVFSLIFFQPRGVGDYRLYDPGSDGPSSLVPQATMNAMRSAEVYNWLRQVDAGLARASLSIDPSEPVDTLSGQPSAHASITFARLKTIGERLTSDVYARRWNHAQGEVDAKASFENFWMPASHAIFRGEDGSAVLKVALQIPPERLVLEQVQADYVLSFEVQINIADPSQKELSQTQNRQEIHLDQQQFEHIRQSPLVFSLVWPITPLAQRASFLWRQEGSAKGLGRAEITWPEPLANTSSQIALVGPWLGIVYEKPQNRSLQALDLLPTAGIFAKSQSAWAAFQVQGPAGDSLPKNSRLQLQPPSQKPLDILLQGSFDPAGVFEVLAPLSLQEPLASLQEWKAVLFLDGKAVQTSSWSIKVLPPDAPTPWLVRHLSELQNVSAALERAYQSLAGNQNSQALAELQKAMASDPTDPAHLLSISYMLLELRQPQELTRFLDPKIEPYLDSKNPLDSTAIKILGLAATAKGRLQDWPQASKLYKKALESAPESTQLMNALAATLLPQGQKKEALELLRRSLTQEPGQEKIVNLLKNMENPP